MENDVWRPNLDEKSRMVGLAGNGVRGVSRELVLGVGFSTPIPVESVANRIQRWMRLLAPALLVC